VVSGYLPDSDRVIDALNDVPDALELLEMLAPSGVSMSLIAFGELYERAY